MRKREGKQRLGAIARLIRLALLMVFLLVLPRDGHAQAITILHHFQDGSVPSDGAGPEGSLIQGSDGYFYGTTSYGGVSNYGIVFKASPQGTVIILHLFSGLDGFNPAAPLFQASDGNFYGTTEEGAGNSGTVFKITSSGQFTTLHNFNDGSVANDGGNPVAGLIQGSDGSLYGTTVSGGANGEGTVYKMTRTGSVTILHSFTGATGDGANPLGALVQATDGNFYGTTELGGIDNAGTIFQITPQGQTQVIHSFVGTDGDAPASILVQAADGCLYGVSNTQVAEEYGSFFKCTLTGSLTVLYIFGSGSVLQEGGYPSSSLLLASDGNFYGITTGLGTAGYGTIFELTPQGVLMQLHSFGDGTVPNDGTSDGGLVQGSNGLLYGVSGGNVNSSLDNNAGTIYSINLAGPAFTSPLSAAGRVGVPFTYTTVATHLPTNYAASNLPDGLSINASSGLVTGTPTTAETNVVTITATNAAGSNSVSLTITIAAAPTPAMTSLPEAFATAGTPFSFTLTATNAPTQFIVNGLSGTGLTVNASTGVISGTPTTAQTIVASVTPRNSVGSGASSSFTIVVGSAAPDITQRYVILHNFGDGSTPNDVESPQSLIQGFDGNFYGPAESGGPSGLFGGIFRLNYQGTDSLLESFTSTTTLSGAKNILQASDGKFYYFGTDDFGGAFGFTDLQGNPTFVSPTTVNPFSPLVQSTDGNFYGTSGGGTANLGFAFKLTPTGNLTVLHNFGDGSVANDGQYPSGGLILGSDGNFYGTTSLGGVGGLSAFGTIYRMTPQGVITILYTFTNGGANGINPDAGLVQYTDGSFYGVTSEGGTAFGVRDSSFKSAWVQGDRRVSHENYSMDRFRSDRCLLGRS